MHNRIGFNRLDRKSSHRTALHRNMVSSLIKYERIKTTKAKARAVRRTAEKLVTRAKKDSVHNRRIAAKFLYEKEVVNKLFTEFGPRFLDRPGGYTRILKLGYRSGDAAQMVILEFLQADEELIPGENSKKSKTVDKKSSKRRSDTAGNRAETDARAEETSRDQSQEVSEAPEAPENDSLEDVPAADEAEKHSSVEDPEGT